MRSRRKNSLRSSKLPFYLRSSGTHHHTSKARSPLPSFDSPETLIKKGKIRIVSEKLLRKPSHRVDIDDQRKEGNRLFTNRRIVDGIDGEETVKGSGTSALGNSHSEDNYGERCETHRKFKKRALLSNENISSIQTKIDSASYRTKLRQKLGNTTNSKDDIQHSKDVDSVIQEKNSSDYSIQTCSVGLSDTLHKNTNGIPVRGVITRHSSSATMVQPAPDAEKEIQPNQHVEAQHSSQSILHTIDGCLEGDTKYLRRHFTRSTSKAITSGISADAGQSSHMKRDQTLHLDSASRDSYRQCNDSDALCHPEKARTVNASGGTRKINHDESSIVPGKSKGTDADELINASSNFRNSSVQLRRTKRKQSPTYLEYSNDECDPDKSPGGLGDQTEDVAVQDVPILQHGTAAASERSPSILEHGSTAAALEKPLSIYTEAEDEISQYTDPIKVNPMSKSCLVATNPAETGGRQMRARPLDLEQPLLVLIEGLDKDYYELDGGSFYRLLQQQPELNSPSFISQIKPDGISKHMLQSVDTREEKAESIIIPSFRPCRHPCQSTEHPPFQYELPDSYIRMGSSTGQLEAEYDIDDEDEEWLNKYNQSVSSSSTLTVEQFEKIIDLLEMKAAEANGFYSVADFFEEDQKQVSEECCICNGGENAPDNPVYECASCHVLVHKSCYGIEKYWKRGKKRQKWKCKKCEAVAEGNIPPDIRCSLCCKQGGALKPSTEPHKWAHVVCALYTNETYFVNPDAMEPIDGLSAADARAKRQKRQCVLCGMREGSVERCSVPGCKAVFHVSCGVNQGASFEFQHSNQQVTSVLIYCPSHALTANGAAKRMPSEEEEISPSNICSQEFLGKKDSSTPDRPSGDFLSRTSKEKASSSHGKDLGKSSNGYNMRSWEIIKKERELGTFAEEERVYNCISEMMLDADLLKDKETSGKMLSEKEYKKVLSQKNSDFMERIYLYWVSKRAKQGGPLLHHIQQEQAAKSFGIFNPDDAGSISVNPVSVGSFQESSIDMKVLTAWQQLRVLRKLTLLVVQRERLKLEIFSLDQDILNIGFEALNDTSINQQCSSCKGLNLCFPCVDCNIDTCICCLVKNSKYRTGWDVLMHPKYVCSNCEKKNLKMHKDLPSRFLANPKENSASCFVNERWSEKCNGDMVTENSQTISERKPYILLPRCDCSNQDKSATQAFWEQTHSKTALISDLTKNRIQMVG
ncbi:hypothetical protein KP509_36G054100 [Ceratopteris richardii]|uniref:Uncharacterized protein n=1 Tax=Ceratopteris richardii TaxID=49495 RepID=A0A8T2QBS9_CERRI|nr:hypothetical protein KP509_36G054100 [Ceratopteris richardii]